MTDYTGQQMMPGVTDVQARAIEAATRMCPPEFHDGVLRGVAAALGDTPPFTNTAVKDAIKSVLAGVSITNVLDLEG
jgi:hypothetical protein